MRKIFRLFTSALALLIFSSIPFTGQAQQHRGRKKAWPDSLTLVTFKGTVIIDTTHTNMYFLDVDQDDSADYRMGFGPDWYEPESGAVRPAAGDHITVVGHVNQHPVYPVLIVFELDGLVWRESIENWWKHKDWCDSLSVITAAGTILVDTTYFYTHYFLDIDSDDLPDYQLSFGPPWFEPASGAVRPEAGASVTIEGAVKENSDPTRLIVLKIDDLIWRDQFGPPPWTGGWVGKDKKNHKRIYCPYDSSSWVEIPPGALKGNSHHGMNFPDSIFCEFMKVWHDSLPGQPDSACAGWHFHFSNPAGKQVKGNGQIVRFFKQLRLHLNLCQDDSSGMTLGKYSPGQLELKYWNEDDQLWYNVENAEFDAVNQVVVVKTESIDAYLAVFTKSAVTTVNEESAADLPDGFVLEQNYPNPFNPETHIRFSIQANSQVKLSIYNLIGQQVRTLVDAVKPAGVYDVVWDGRDNSGNLLSTGTYFYKIQVDGNSQIRRLVLLK